MPRYVIAGGQFTPFSYEELIRPVEDSATAHMTAQEALDALAMQAGDIASQIGDGTGDNARTAALYKAYNDLVEKAGNDMYENGYNAISARGLSQARQAYGRDVTRIRQAIENRARQAEAWRKATIADPTLMSEFNPATRGLDNWLDDPQYGDWRHYSGNTLVGQGDQLGKNIARQLREGESHWRPILGNQYYEKVSEYGVTADEVNDAVRYMKEGRSSDDVRRTSPFTAMLMDGIGSVYESSKMGDWADVTTRDRAYDFIGQGLYSGIGKPDDKQLANRGYGLSYPSGPGSGGGGGNAVTVGRYEPELFSMDRQTRNYNKVMNEIRRSFDKHYEDGRQYVIRTPDGKAHTVSNVEEATRLIYETPSRVRTINSMGGVDIGRRLNRQEGTVTDIDGNRHKIRVEKEGGAYVVRMTDNDGKWYEKPNAQLTKALNDAVGEYEAHIAAIERDNPDLDIKRIAVTPDRMNDLRERYGYEGYAIDGARGAVESAAYIGKSAGRYLASNTPGNDLMRETIGAKLYEGLSGTGGGKDDDGKPAIRAVDGNGNISDKPVKDYSDVFVTDKDGTYIINDKSVSYYAVTPESLAMGGVVMQTPKGVFFVPAELFGGTQVQDYVHDRQLVMSLITPAIYNPAVLAGYDESQKEMLAAYGVDYEMLVRAVTDPEYRGYLKEALDNVMRGTSWAGGQSIGGMLEGMMRDNVFQGKGATSEKEQHNVQQQIMTEE